MNPLFADVILPLPLHDTYTYVIPAEWHDRVVPGKRVLVSFGLKKSYSALVVAVHSNVPQGIELKMVEQVLDEEPLLSAGNLELWKWISHYYISPMGDVMRAALPSALKLGSSTEVAFNPDSGVTALSDEERTVIRILGNKRLPVREIANRLAGDFTFLLLKRMVEKEILLVEEYVREKYKPKTIPVITLNPGMAVPEEWDSIVAGLGRARKQKALLIQIGRSMSLFSPEQVLEIPKSRITQLEYFSESALKQLIAKDILRMESRKVSRLVPQSTGQTPLNKLSDSQQEAHTEINRLFGEKPVVLLYGVTASGKTEIYIRLIAEALERHQQVLYLVPEISLTPQIVHRLRQAFGDRVGVYHSRMDDNLRVEVWNKVLSFGADPAASYQVVLGARSALFLPFVRPGLIIVDEEHENSYKQGDSSPRYHARDMAVVAGMIYKAPVLLGSATPSFESWHNARTGKYGLVTLPTRYGAAALPEIIIADTARARKRREMHAMLTPELYHKIGEALEKQEQVILFQNRRGYALFIECMNCGWVPKCVNCDVSLTLHRKSNQLICHYCGYGIQVPVACGKCGATDIKGRGFGTEKVEEELSILFPGARIARMDLDTTRSRSAFEKMIGQLEQHKIDILAGTQMVTKGLDFGNVSVVGILNADHLINYPDFRAYERAFQLMTQVSGRSGRKDKKGCVVIQTSQPEHEVIRYVKEHDYESLFNALMPERKLFRYPPWYRLVKIAVRHKDPVRAAEASVWLADYLRTTTSFTVLGPEAPLVSRVQQWYIREVWLKVAKDSHSGDLQLMVSEAVDMVKKRAGNSGILVQPDVDAV